MEPGMGRTGETPEAESTDLSVQLRPQTGTLIQLSSRWTICATTNLIFKSLQSEPNLNCLILYNPFCNLFLSLKRTKCFTLLYIWSFISCFFILSNFQIHSEIDELHQHLQARRGSYGNSLPAARMNSQAFKQFEMTVEVKKNVDELFQISWI